MLDDLPSLPTISRLHERHYGLTEAISRYYAEGAAVCMQRHHVSPKTVGVSMTNEGKSDYIASWQAPSDRVLVAWANRDDATRDAAYGMVIAAAEVHLGLYVFRRAEPGSGSDYLFSDNPCEQSDDDILDLDSVRVYRLEVSGIDVCSGERHLERRLSEKVAQLASGRSDVPGIAGVIGFNMAQLRFRRLS